MNEPFLPQDLPGLTQAASNTTTASAATPSTGTHTLTGFGQWLVTVVAKLNGSRDHQMVGTWLVTYDDQTNDTLLATQVGATAKATGSSFGLSTLTLSNPTSGGVLTATAAWTDAANHAVIFRFAAQRIALFVNG